MNPSWLFVAMLIQVSLAKDILYEFTCGTPKCLDYFDGCNNCACSSNDVTPSCADDPFDPCTVERNATCRTCEDGSYWLRFDTFQSPGFPTCDSRFLASPLLVENNSKCACPKDYPFWKQGVGCINEIACDANCDTEIKAVDTFKYNEAKYELNGISNGCSYEYQLCTSDADCAGYGQDLLCNIPTNNYVTCIPLSAQLDKNCELEDCDECLFDDCMGTGYGYCSSSKDCEIGGCFEEICASDINECDTICIDDTDLDKCEYSCLEYQVCGRVDNEGTCGWKSSPDLESNKLYEECIEQCEEGATCSGVLCVNGQLCYETKTEGPACCYPNICEDGICNEMRGIHCNEGYECVENPFVACDPTTADCYGVCVDPDAVKSCGGFENCFSYNNGCSDCRCSNNGFDACAQRLCPPETMTKPRCTACNDGYILNNGECVERSGGTANRDCLVGDIMLQDGQINGHIGWTCTGDNTYDGTQSRCVNGELIDEPYKGDCSNENPGSSCCQRGNPGDRGAVVCIDANECVPNCVPKGATYLGDVYKCKTLSFSCGTGEEPWFSQCGCGCLPLSPPLVSRKLLSRKLLTHNCKSNLVSRWTHGLIKNLVKSRARTNWRYKARKKHGWKWRHWGKAKNRGYYCTPNTNYNALVWQCLASGHPCRS